MTVDMLGKCYLAPHGKGALKVIDRNPIDSDSYVVIYVRTNPKGAFGNGIDVLTKSSFELNAYASLTPEQFQKYFDRKIADLTKMAR